MGHFLHRLCGLGIWVAVTSCADGPSRGVEDLVGFLRDGRTIRSPISLPVLLIVGGMTACVVVPTPPTHSGNARQNVDASTSTRFHPGKSTREGVILSLGEPDVSTADERKLSYRTEMTKAWLLVGGYASGAAARINKDDYLVFEFDRKGLLTASKTSGQWVTHSNPEITLGSSAGADNAGEWATDATWLTGVDDYRTTGVAEGVKWERGTLTLASDALRFRSRGDFANAPSALVIRYRNITSANEDRKMLGNLLAVHTRDGKAIAFQILGASTWRSDPKRLETALAIIRRRMGR